MQYIKKISAILFVYLFLNSCSDDDATHRAFMPANSGNYWIYSNYILSSATDNASQKLNANDSLAYLKDTNFLGKSANKYLFNHYNYIRNKDTASFVYAHEENNKLYVSSSFLEIFMPDFGINIDPQWVKLADRNETKWTVVSIPINNMKLPISDVLNISFSGNLDFSATNNGKNSIDVPTGTYNNVENFTVTVKLNGKITMSLIPIPISDVIVGKINYYFANGIGLISIVSEPITLSIPMMPDQGMKMQGFKKLLERYKI